MLLQHKETLEVIETDNISLDLQRVYIDGVTYRLSNFIEIGPKKEEISCD